MQQAFSVVTQVLQHMPEHFKESVEAVSGEPEYINVSAEVLRLVPEEVSGEPEWFNEFM